MKRLLALLLLLALLSGCSMLPAEEAQTEATTPTETLEEELTVHFIDVGQADCALLVCGDTHILIDGGNVEDSSLVVSYLTGQGIEELDLVICSHAHEDHVGGLPGVLAVFPTEEVWSPTKTYSSNVYEDFLYYVDQQGLEVTIPSPGDSFTEGDLTLTVLGPVKSYEDTNNTSLVVMAQYGQTRFLFTGDMETMAETDLLDSGADVKADVLKVGHHGSNTSSGYRFLYEVDPEYAVISVGEGNSYGHPHEEPMSRLRDADITIYRTDEMGTVLAVSDGENITFSWEEGSAAPEDPEAAEVTYIGNVNSKVVHLSSCSNLPAEQNRIQFESYEEAVDAGYRACSNCMK